MHDENQVRCRARLASGGGRVACQPIATLNPYSNDWTIRAKLVSKAPLRHFDKGGQQMAVFSIEVVDEQVRAHAACNLPLCRVLSRPEMRVNAQRAVSAPCCFTCETA